MHTDRWIGKGVEITGSTFVKTLLDIILYLCSESNVCKFVNVCVGVKVKGYMHKTVHERYLRFRMFL